jgi:transposase
MLRREGVYSSHLAAWRKARAKGERKGLEAKQRGPKAMAVDPIAQKLAEQEREMARWKAALSAPRRSWKSKKTFPECALTCGARNSSCYKRRGPGGAAVCFLETMVIP